MRYVFEELKYRHRQKVELEKLKLGETNLFSVVPTANLVH